LRALLLVLLFVLLSPELQYVSRETSAAETPVHARVSVSREEVAQGLTCQCGCGLTVANCNMPTCGFSVPMRAEIDDLIDKGMSRGAIIAFYRHKYGEKVLSAPTTEGFNLLAWTMPFIALAIGGGLIVLAFGRWRSNTAPVVPSPESAPAPTTFDPELRRRLEKELEERR
jgi:cytochrome c-type biogenesis protein CcmH